MKRIGFAFLLIVLVILLGSTGYMVLENWSLLDAFYMTIITISTVGFEEVASLDASSRIFTVILIIFGIGIGGYTMGNVTAFILEGHIQNMLKGKKMEKLLNSLKDHVIVCGFGRTGVEICDVLEDSNADFVIIEKDEERVGEARRKNYLTINGDATDDEILMRAEVKNAHSLIAALGNDADNVYVVLTARGLHSKLKIIARGTDDKSTLKLLKAGADKVVSPFSIAGRRMANLASKPDIVEFLEVMTQGGALELKIEQIRINKNSALDQKQLNQSNIKSLTNGSMIIGIKKNNTDIMKINPPGDTILEVDDIMIAIGNDIQINLLKKLAS